MTSISPFFKEAKLNSLAFSFLLCICPRITGSSLYRQVRHIPITEREFLLNLKKYFTSPKLLPNFTQDALLRTMKKSSFLIIFRKRFLLEWRKERPYIFSQMTPLRLITGIRLKTLKRLISTTLSSHVWFAVSTAYHLF